jgi:hypothetical protein
VIRLPHSHVSNARALLSAGWRPADAIGCVAPPLGLQLTAAQYTDDWTWRAMVLMQLAAEPGNLP